MLSDWVIESMSRGKEGCILVVPGALPSPAMAWRDWTGLVLSCKTYSRSPRGRGRGSFGGEITWQRWCWKRPLTCVLLPHHLTGPPCLADEETEPGKAKCLPQGHKIVDNDWELRPGPLIPALVSLRCWQNLWHLFCYSPPPMPSPDLYLEFTLPYTHISPLL